MSEQAAKDVIQLIMSQLGAADRPLIETTLRNVLNEFLVESTAWREFVEITITPTQSDYDLNPVDSNSIVAWVHGIFDSIDKPYTPLAYQPPAGTQQAGAVTFTVLAPSTIKIRPLPDANTTGYVLVSKTLKPGSLSIPEYINTHFRRAVIDGMLGAFYGHSTKPYADAVKAEQHNLSFRNQIVRARDIVKRGFTTAAPAWAFPQNFAKGTGQFHGGY